MGKEDNKAKDGVDQDEDEVVELCRLSTVVTLTGTLILVLYLSSVTEDAVERME